MTASKYVDDLAAQAKDELDLAEAIVRNNDIFEAASPAEQRVIIAKDVLAMLQSGRFEAGWGYGSEFGGQCRGCALAATFVAICDRGKDQVDRGFNPVKGQSIRPKYMRKALEPWFTESQLRLIETAYECWDFGHNDPKTIDRAIDFGRKAGCRNPNRLIAIMENVIENEGTFKP